ncbi:MAG: beta-N-acetylhexosaminidase [Bacteroidales bacterium]
MKKHFFILISLIALFCSCIKEVDNAKNTEEINIVPKPISCTIADSGAFILKGCTKIYVPKDKAYVTTTEIFAEQMDKLFDFAPTVRKGYKSSGINIIQRDDLAQEEYVIEVGQMEIRISVATAQGAAHALQTLRQIIVQTSQVGNKARIPQMVIKDKPFFNYRGMMLDVCRHFSPVKDVKRFIDILALHKVNKFHWHLTEDQGWRIEIKKYPKLTEYGAIRKETVIGHALYSKKYDGKPYGEGLFYTQEQIKEVVAYATERHIEVIPEIELPGHALAALACYPELGCTGGPYEVSPTWGVFDDVYCAGRETTFEFLQNVLDEVVELFPSKYIHIGGDECPKTRWKKCEHCQARMKVENLKNEDELQSYFVRRIEQYLQDKNRSIIGWEEILHGGVTPTATIMAWLSAQAGIDAAKLGNQVIMTPTKNYYFDYYQSKDTINEPFSIGGYVPVSTVYEFNPYDKLHKEEQKAIWGVQANLWREYIKTFEHIEYMTLPRLAAMAESGWSYDRKNYEEFLKRMRSLKKLYDKEEYNYAKHIFE